MSEQQPQRGRLEPLPRAVRLILFVIGIVLIALGLVSAVLPILQGWLFLLMGAAVLSLASDALYKRLLVFLRRRWPAVSRRLRDLRRRAHAALRPKK